MFELTLQCPQAQVEIVSDALEALEAQSVSVEDSDALTQSEQPLFGEPGMEPSQIGWRHSTVKALFASEALAQEATELLQAQDFFTACQVVGMQPLAEQDWVRLTQSQFAPVPISPGFWIVPTWHEPPADAKHIIRLDPGLAFGTGTHPTTRMCLQWIAQGRGPHPLGRVLDYGCGSGILAIAAAMMGAQEVDALDIDPTVLAKILATPLKVLAPLLCARVANGGHLVLSGILERQADELMQAYAAYVRLKVAAAQEGWVLMTAST